MLALLTLAFFHRVVLTPGGVLVGDDLRNFFYPMLTFVVRELRAGALPFWNPHIFAGVSVIADPEIAIYYPPNWLLLALGVERGMTWLLVAHVWWAAWGMARLTRSFGASALGGLFGGVTYGFSGWLVAQVWAGHYTLAQVAAWLPWTLLAYQHALKVGSWRAALPGIAALGLTVLAGFPPLMIHLGLLLAALATLHVLTAPDWRPALILAVRQLALMLVGGALLAAVQLLPVAEFTPFSTRGVAADLEFAGSFPLPGAQLLTLPFPGLLGSPAKPTGYWGNPFYEELMGFAGLWALVAFLLALRLRDGVARLLLALAVLGAVLSLGLHGGLLIVLLHWLPFFRLFRVPGRYLYLVVFAMSGLTALVVTHLGRSDPDERREWVRPAWRVWGIGGALLALAGAGALWFGARFAPPETHVVRLLAMRDSLAASGVVLLAVAASFWLWGQRRGAGWGALLALGVIVVDLWRVSLPLVNVAPASPRPPIWDEVAASVPAGDPTARVMPLVDAFWEQNGAIVSGHYNVYGYESLESDAYTRFVELSAAPSAANNRLLGVGYVVTPKPFDQLGLEGSEAVELLAEGGHFVYRLEDAVPRAFLATSYEILPDDDDARARLVAADFDPAQTAILATEPGCAVGGDGGMAALEGYSPNRVTIHVDAGDPGLLVLTDQWYPGWQATVDGNPAEVLRADTVFRAVCVPEGQHTVTFRYRPASLRRGALISLVGWLALAVAWTAGRQKNRAAPSDPNK